MVNLNVSRTQNRQVKLVTGFIKHRFQRGDCTPVIYLFIYLCQNFGEALVVLGTEV
jgi:hypothetical protein